MKIILQFIFLLTFQIAFANDTLQTKETQITVKQIESVEDISSTTYKLLYENQLEFNDKIIETVYWSLGGTLAVILLVIGSNIYFNVRFNKKEVEQITIELLGKLEDAKNQYLNEINQKINSSTDNLRKTIERDKQELSKSYQGLLKSYNDNLNLKIDTLKEFNEEKTRLIMKEVEGIASLQNDIINRRISIEIKTLRRNVLQDEAEIWILKDFYSNALVSYIRLAKLDFDIKYDWAFKYNSEDIIKCLGKVDSIASDDLAELKLVLDIANEEYGVKVDEIRRILKNKKVKEV